MKICLAFALAALAISFTVPTFAQQKETVDPQTIEQVTAMAIKFDEAFNNNDAVALAALYTEDGVLVTPQGPIYGRDSIEKYWADTFKQIHVTNHLNKADQNSIRFLDPTGNEVWRNGEWSLTLQGKSGDPLRLKGYWGAVNVREGDTWKTRMLTFNTTPAPAK